MGTTRLELVSTKPHLTLEGKAKDVYFPLFSHLNYLQFFFFIVIEPVKFLWALHHQQIIDVYKFNISFN